MKKIFLLIALFLSVVAGAQDISYNRKMVDTLTSPVFWGRGYTKDGMKKAAVFWQINSDQWGLRLWIKMITCRNLLSP